MSTERPLVPLFEALARALQQLENCKQSGNTEWLGRTEARIRELCKHLPSGSGIDSGCKLLLDASTPERLVFQCDFHHMDEHGHYCGWTEHQVVVTPTLQDKFRLRITGRNHNEVKDYLHEVVYFALRELVSEYPERKDAQP